MKIDKTVKKETLFILCGSVILSVIEQSVFLMLGKWDVTVLSANLMMDVVTVLDFFFLGLTLQKAVTKSTAAEVKKLMMISRALRYLMIGAAFVTGILLKEAFCLWALIPPVFFNRITLVAIQIRMKHEAPEPTEKSLAGEDDEEVTEANGSEDNKI